MAVTKTPRKLPATEPTLEAKPEAKAKATTVKKPGPKASVAKTPKAKTAAKVPAALRSQEVEATPLDIAVVAAPVPQPAPERVPGSATLPPLVEAILLAIQEGRAVEFLFADADANAPRTFEPRHLLFDALSQAWYVLSLIHI